MAFPFLRQGSGVFVTWQRIASTVLAEATQRSKSFLAAEATPAFVETNEWQVGEIQAALKEADASDGAGEIGYEN